MKIFHKLLSALMVLPVVAAFTACSEEDDYTPAEVLANAQVFFANDLSEKISLSDGESSFDVTVNRQNTKGEVTVPITSEQDEANLFGIPAEVTFADGEATANLTITYDPSVMEFDDMHPITLTLGDEKYATPYGNTTYSFEAGIQPPFTEWVTTAEEYEKLGVEGFWPLSNMTKKVTGSYLYTQYLSGVDEGLSIAFRQNELFPNQVQFKIGPWFAGDDLILTGEWDEENGLYRISLPTTYAGYTHPNYGKVYVGDYNAWSIFFEKDTYPWETLYENSLACYYKPEEGIFYLHIMYYVGAGWFGEWGTPETFTVDGYKRNNYSVTPTFVGILKTASNEDQAVIDFEFGRHSKSAKWVLTPASISEEEAMQGLVSGELEAAGEASIMKITSQNWAERAYLTLAGLDEGQYRATAVTYDEEGEAQMSGSVVFEYEKNNNWESLGIGLWTEDLMTLLYSSDGETPLEPEYYEVEILASTKTPGLYRVENPYGEAGWGTLISKYIEVNAEDPNHVYIPYTDLFDDDGVISIESSGSYYMSQGYSVDVIDANMSGCFGKLEDGVIGGWGVNRFYAYVDGELYNYGNGNGAFEIVLPEAYESEVKAQRVPGKKAGKAGARKIKRKGISRTQIPAPTTMGRFSTRLSKNFENVKIRTDETVRILK